MKIKKEEFTKLTNNWKTALPVNLGNLFSYVEQGENKEEFVIKRYDTYHLELEETDLDMIKNNEDNIETIAISMGMVMEAMKSNDKKFTSAQPNELSFRPILDIQLKDKSNYYFLLTPFKSSFNLLKQGNEQQLSPKVAELFILKWQCLTDSQLIDAFECMSPSSAEITEDSKFRITQQSIKRVNQFIFNEEESREIIANFLKNENNEFYVHLGAGLAVPVFHPFNFRPIVKIKGSSVGENRRNSSNGNTYYDTSKPCPPFCGRPPSGINKKVN